MSRHRMRARHRIYIIFKHLLIAQPETDQHLNGCIGISRPLQNAIFLQTRHMTGKRHQCAGLSILRQTEGREAIDKECSGEKETNQGNKERESSPAWSARAAHPGVKTRSRHTMFSPTKLSSNHVDG